MYKDDLKVSNILFCDIINSLTNINNSQFLRYHKIDRICIDPFFNTSDSSIGIKHGFSCTNIRQVPREVLKTEADEC